MSANVNAGAEGTPDPQEALLVRRLAGCARGQTNDLEKLYAALSPQLFGFLLRILHRSELAEEALQETFVKIWRKAADYRADRGRVKTWIFTIARYQAYDMLRRGRREFTVEPDSLAGLLDADTAASQDDEPLRSLAETRRLRHCLDALSEQQRASIMLAYVHGHTQEEIAHHFEAPLGTVKSWVRRALIRLKRCLEG